MRPFEEILSWKGTQSSGMMVCSWSFDVVFGTTIERRKREKAVKPPSLNS
jgi:hypothetical protein